MIEVNGLTKRYGDLVAVDGLSFRVEAGEIFGLLGPNGAGKSTTIGCISGLVAPGDGSVRVLGLEVSDGVAARRSLGVVPQDLALYEELSAVQNLRYWGAAYGMRGHALKRRIAEVLDLVGLEDRAREPCGNFSGGMKRRLNFACGIVHRPQVLLLDEPTVGVDPQSRVKLLDLVRAQAQQGACVLYTTHYMEEAEGLCDRVGIVDHGRLIALGSLAELRSQVGERDLLRLSGRFDPEKVGLALRDARGQIGDVELAQANSEQLTLALQEASRKLPAIFETLAQTGAEVRESTLTQPNLEALFIKLTGKELRS